MGLLDQVLGQVIGGMAAGRPEPGRPPRGGGVPSPQPGGGLGDLLGGAAGKYSPLVMALLALLASRSLGSGAGGYGSVLNDVFGRIAGGSAPGREAGGGLFGGPDGSPDRAREDGGDDEAPRGPPGRSGGGFLDSVGSLLDGPGGQGSGRAAGWGQDGGAPVGGGLEDLAERFRRNGQGEAMDSWIGAGGNREIGPDELGRALGPDTLEQLSRQSGLGRDDLLEQLSRALPQVVDGLTPRGRLPSGEERRGWV